jgi:hypothetical protein
LTLKSLSGAVAVAMVSQVSAATTEPQCDIQPTKQCVYQTIVKQISELPVKERDLAQKNIGYQNLEEILGRVATAREIEVVKASHQPYFFAYFSGTVAFTFRRAIRKRYQLAGKI